MHRALVVLLALAFLLPVSAQAQDTPFGPVPTPEPTVEPASGSDDVGRGTLYAIAGGVLVAVVGIGWAISRDARRSLTPEDRERLERAERSRPDPQGAASKQARTRAHKQRRKVKAARRARRHNR